MRVVKKIVKRRVVKIMSIYFNGTYIKTRGVRFNGTRENGFIRTHKHYDVVRGKISP